jgi:hypothetical protein
MRARPGLLLDGIDRRRIRGQAFAIELKATLLLRDEFAESLEVLSPRLMTHVVSGDVNDRESVGEFAHVVGSPGEEAGKVFDVGLEEDGDGLAIAAGVEDAFVPDGESVIHLGDGTIGEGAELEGSGARAFSEGKL